MRIRGTLAAAALCGAAVLAAASFFTYPAASPHFGAPLLKDARIDARVLGILERSCGDCHSERTRYPWYARVAPVSWWLGRHVSEGRGRLNLSRWDEYPVLRKTRSLSEIANQVKDGEMPIRAYTLLHPDARLSAGDVDAIFRWTQAERARLVGESLSGAPR
jgi:hypothetical protein